MPEVTDLRSVCDYSGDCMTVFHQMQARLKGTFTNYGQIAAGVSVPSAGLLKPSADDLNHNSISRRPSPEMTVSPSSAFCLEMQWPP